jgi:predicted nuclease of restriction endonuclease-like (RecB) superfamily
MAKSRKKTVVVTESLSKIPVGYKALLESIVDRIKAAQTRAMVAVNRELIEVYRDIGKTIYEKQQIAEWGASVVEQLSKDLQVSFPGTRGFSSRNLWNMRDFYRSYADNEKLQAMTAEISWTHNVVLFQKCKDHLEREFYMKMTKRNGWTYRVLIHHIEMGTFEKTVMTQSNNELPSPEQISKLLDHIQ